MKTYYQILALDKRASQDEIKRAYRRLSLQFHPDKNQGEDELFKLVNEAYKVLSDSTKRAEYDASLKQKSGPSVKDVGSTHSPNRTDYITPEELLNRMREVNSATNRVRGFRNWSRIGVALSLAAMLYGGVGLSVDDVKPYSSNPISSYKSSSQQQKHPADYGLSTLLLLGGLAGTVANRRTLREQNQALKVLERKKNQIRQLGIKSGIKGNY